MKAVYYQDFIAKPGDEPVFAISGVFRALHGLMRRTGAELVVVPFYLSNAGKPSLREEGGAPDGLRVFFDAAGLEHFAGSFGMPAPLADAVVCRPLKRVDESQVAGVVHVRRLRTKSSPSALRRFERRNPGVDAAGFAENVAIERRRRPGIHVWHQREDGARFPLFFSVLAEKGAPSHFAGNNTHGCGTAPLVDFVCEIK